MTFLITFVIILSSAKLCKSKKYAYRPLKLDPSQSSYIDMEIDQDTVSEETIFSLNEDIKKFSKSTKGRFYAIDRKRRPLFSPDLSSIMELSEVEETDIINDNRNMEDNLENNSDQKLSDMYSLFRNGFH